MNENEHRWSLFDYLADPLRPGDTPLAWITDLELAYIVASWKNNLNSS